MKKQLTAACLLSLALPSCTIVDHVVFGQIGNAIAPPEIDAVVVEEGSGLPETALPAATVAQATAKPVAAAPVTTPVAAVPAPVAAPVAKPEPVVAASGKTYTVVKGDTLNGIARRLNCTPQALIAANGITNPNALKLGQVLNIPAAGAAPVAAALPTPTTPAKKPVAATKKQSSGNFWKSLKFWKQQSAPAVATYIVQPGDTLGAIARKHGTTLQAMLAANNMTMAQANTLKIGQTILLPATASKR